jgi:hypothetical protein
MRWHAALPMFKYPSLWLLFRMVRQSPAICKDGVIAWPTSAAAWSKITTLSVLAMVSTAQQFSSRIKTMFLTAAKLILFGELHLVLF